MVTIHTMTPFHHHYPRPQAVQTSKKEQPSDKPVTFHEILTQKLNEKTAAR